MALPLVVARPIVTGSAENAALLVVSGQSQEYSPVFASILMNTTAS